LSPRVKRLAPEVIAGQAAAPHTGALQTHTEIDMLSRINLATALDAPAASAATPLPTRFLDTEGGRLAYDDTGGAGPVVVCVPGMGDLRGEYRALRPALVAAGWRVLTLDVRGFGDSSASWSELSARAVGRDVVRLIEHLRSGPAIVLGNSFAAGAALWAARQAPQGVDGVVLLGPIVRDAPPNPLMRAVLRLGFAGPWRLAFWMAYWNSLFPLRRPPDHAEAREALRRNLREPGRMDALRTMVGLSKADTEAMLPDSRVPALVVMGTRDPDFADATAEARWLAQGIGAELMLVEGAGHYPHLECPGQVAPRVLDFLRERLAARAR